MANEKVLLKAKASQLGIEGYRTMSLDELKAAVANASGSTSAPVKGKSSANGAKDKSASKTAVSTATKGKTAPAKGKSTSRKTAPAKGKATAAKGKASRAASTKTKTTKVAKGHPGKTKRAPVKRAPAKRKTVSARVDIDRSKIDWRVESNVGRNGKRAEVMAELRRRHGNYDKVHDALEHRAKAFYPGKTKHDAERMLRWLINRVAYDYVMVTGQHKKGQRAAYGTSNEPQDIYRRERREQARKEAAKAARAAKRGAAKKPARGKGKSSLKRATAKRR